MDSPMHWPHQSARQRQRMSNTATPRRIDLAGCDFPQNMGPHGLSTQGMVPVNMVPHMMTPGMMTQGMMPQGMATHGMGAPFMGQPQDLDGNSLMCVKNTFIDMVPQAPLAGSRGQRRSMPTLPAGVYYS